MLEWEALIGGKFNKGMENKGGKLQQGEELFSIPPLPGCSYRCSSGCWGGGVRCKLA
jgi:hypothetical protein